MKKMKSIFKTLLCLVLVFVLVSCSANKMSFDSNGDVVQSKPYDVVWNGFQTQKGEYEISEGIVKLIQNETDKSLDNYPSYDYYNFKETYTNFTYETIIKIDQTELDQTTLDGKFGIKISYDDNNYLTCFLVPKHETLKICLLGMSNGTWIELWAPPNADDFVMPEELDLTQNGVKLKIERNNGIVYLYYNDTLIHTEYNFIPDSKQALKVGVTSERVNLVTYSNIKIEEVPLKKIKLNTPEVSLSGNILKIDETDFAENYYLFIDDEHQKIKVKVGENNINTILKELKMTDGTYKLKVFASNSDGERYENSDYSLETNYVFSTSLEALSKPVLSIDGSSIRFDKNENAKNYTMRIYVKSAMELGIDKENYVLVDAFDFDYAGTGYDLNKLSEKLLTDEIYVFEVKANGDGTTYIDSDYSKRLEYQNKNAIFHEVKGSYIGSSNSLSLIKQETLDGDNYGSTNRYDAAYFKTKYVNFSLSTLISNSDTTENISEKYGISIAIDLNTYYDIFVVGNKIIALSQSGGTWVALWQTLYTIPDFERGNDVTLKVERKQDIITVYVNDILASTISNFTLGVDTEVNVGFTSEAISSIDYKNIEISELSK